MSYELTAGAMCDAARGVDMSDTIERVRRGELWEQIKEERKLAKRKCAAKLRALSSCSAEALPDYERINRFVTAASEAAGYLEETE